MAESDEEEIFERAYQAELEKIRIQEIESKARKEAQRDTARAKRRVRKKSAIGRYLQTKALELAGGNKRFLDLTSQQLHIKRVTLTKETLRLAKLARAAEDKAIARWAKNWQECMKAGASPSEFLSKEDAKIISDYNSAKIEIIALFKEILLRERINSY